MDSTGNCSSEPEAANNAPSPPPSSGSSAGDVPKTAHTLEDSAASSPAAKRSRRSVLKRVVSIPISETKGGAGEGAPPSDSWTWRKYGQKPIKGSPYPRGYYRCSSSKGCPARKQVERNSVDPSVIVVTYSFDHNHAWPLPKNNHHCHRAPVEAVEDQPPEPVAVLQQQEQLDQLIISTAQHSSPPESTDRDEKLFDLIVEEESSLLIPNGGFHWFSEVGSSPASTSPGGSDELLYGSAFIGGGASATEKATRLPEEASAGRGELEEEEDSLFAGLGELPEYSFVLRRWLASSAAWVGTT